MGIACVLPKIGNLMTDLFEQKPIRFWPDLESSLNSSPALRRPSPCVPKGN